MCRRLQKFDKMKIYAKWALRVLVPGHKRGLLLGTDAVGWGTLPVFEQMLSSSPSDSAVAELPQALWRKKACKDLGAQ